MEAKAKCDELPIEATDNDRRICAVIRSERILSHFQDEFQENPRMLKAMAECCSKFRRDDFESAVACLSRYIEWRRKTFGDLDDQSVANDVKLREQLQCNFMHLSPVRLSGGEALLYLSMKRHNPSLYSTSDTVKCMHFFIISAMMNDTSLAEKGFVLVNNMADVEFQNLDMNFPAAIASAVGQSVPVRLVNIVIVNPPMLVRFIIPLVKALLTTKLLERLHVVVDLKELPQLLVVAQRALPVEMGGAVEFNTYQDVRRMIAQQFCV